MKAVIQRVANASVTVDGEITGRIEKGFLVLLGVGEGDTKAEADRIVKKLVNLRIFSDGNGKINLSLQDVGGSLLVVSQFTLYADCRHGNRPSFTQAGAPDEANRLYEYFVSLVRATDGIANVGTGEFGADMQVALVNHGPFTIWLDTDTL